MIPSINLSTYHSVYRDRKRPARHDARMPDLQPRFIVDRLEAIERVERVRKAHNLPKGKFAMTLGIAPPNYSRVLKGDFFLTLDQLFTIWQLYNAEPRYILRGVESGLSQELLEKIRAQDATS